MDRELDIRLQFLDEAQEYLDSLEDALLGVADRSIDAETMNGCLRAAHSIKGGAAMMGYSLLSQLAHRLEDAFKVLKVQRAIELDSGLEQLLLSGVDCLRRVAGGNHQALSTGQDPDDGIDDHWLQETVLPVFEQLHEQLGEPQEEDAHSILAVEDSHTIIPLLFQTEVETCLDRLQTSIADRSPHLTEELALLAQELGGLGEMLQLNPFIQFCNYVYQQVSELPPSVSADCVEELAQMALQGWRQFQTLVLAGELDSIPASVQSATSSLSSRSPAAMDWASPEPIEAAPADVPPQNPASAPRLEVARPDVDISQSEQWVTIPHPPLTERAIAADLLPVRRSRGETAIQLADEAINVSTTAKETETTVRVSVKHLEQLNDLFSELTITRNGLELNLKRLRSLVNLLTERVQTLEYSNTQLRYAYDRISLPPSFQSSDASSSSLTTRSIARQGTPSLRSVYPSPLMESPSYRVSSYPLPHSSQSPDSIHSSDRPPSDRTLSDHAVSSNFDSLELDRYSDLHLLSQEVMETIVQIQEVASDIELGLDDTEQTSRELNKTSRQLTTRLNQIRMRPLSDITNRFPKALRELSLHHHKPVQFKVQGDQILLERSILETLADPLLHLVRNAFDHGIEDLSVRRAQGKPDQGKISICASQAHSRIVITVRDDGGGIALDKIRQRARQIGLDETLLATASTEDLLSLIFEPGFSTSDQVTDLSGRGVGLDVVRDRLQQIHGDIQVETQPGQGTTFILSIPFTLSVTRVLLVESHRMPMAFPVEAIEEMLLVPAEQRQAIGDGEVIFWRDRTVPLIQLSRWFRFNAPRPFAETEGNPAIDIPTVLLLNDGDQYVGVQIDRSWGEQEVAIRKVEGQIPLPPGFANCTILGDGRVVPLMSVPDLLDWLTNHAPLHPIPNFAATPSPPSPDRPTTILIVDDSVNVRRLLALTLEKAGYRVVQAKDGQDAIDQLSAGVQVEAVICDIEMPRLDGYGFLAWLRSQPTTQQIPVTMLTSRSSFKHRQLALQLGATAYFSKPYNEHELLQALVPPRVPSVPESLR